MKRGSRASPVITIACPACGALPNERCGSEFCPERPSAAAGIPACGSSTCRQAFPPAGTSPGLTLGTGVDVADDPARGSGGAWPDAVLALASALGLGMGRMEE
jgi:hypothetical protein